MYLTLWFRIYLMEMLSVRSWDVVRFKFERSFKKIFSDKMTSSSLKIIFRSKAFSPSIINYHKCYFQDLLTSVIMVAAMLPIIERPKEFFNI